MSHTSGSAPRTWLRSAPYAVAAALGGTALLAVPASASADPQDGCTDVPALADAALTAQGRNARQLAAPSVGTASHMSTASRVSTVAAPVRTAGQVTYRVRSGDTVGHIALHLGVSGQSIISANALRSDGFIRDGQVLVIPGSQAPAAAAPAPRAAQPSTGYTVRRGDTLSHIAVRTNTTVAALVAANHLTSNGFIRAGQTLILTGDTASAGATPAPARTAGTNPYTIRSGDTLSDIAARTGTTLAAIRSANPGLDDTLQIGQRIALPAAGTQIGNTSLGRTYADSTVRAAQANKDALEARTVPSRAQMQSMIAATARRYGVDPAMAQAVGFQESGFNMRAVSPANAVGAMQVTPSAGIWTSEMAGRRLDLLDPQDNVTAGVLLLRVHVRSGATQENVLAAYYQGMSSVKRNGMYPDTRRYVASVQTLMARYR